MTGQILGRRIDYFPNVQHDERMKAFLFSVAVDPGFVDQETSYNLEMGKLFTRKEYGITNNKIKYNVKSLYRMRKTSQAIGLPKTQVPCFLRTH